MKLKEFELWQVYGEDWLVVVDPDDLTKKVSFWETEAYLFAPDADMDVIRKALVEYRERKEEDESLGFYEVLDEYGINYRMADEAEDYDDDVVLCFPNNSDLKWAVCRMSDLVMGVSDVYRYWDGSNWCEIWSESDVGKITKVVVDEESREILDRWDGRDCYYKRPFHHGTAYRVVTVDGASVEDKYLLIELADCAGVLDWGELVDGKDLDRIRNWVEEEKEEF